MGAGTAGAGAGAPPPVQQNGQVTWDQFNQLYAENPRLAYHSLLRNGPAAWNQHVGRIQQEQFGGDMTRYNQWVNDSDMGNINDQERWRLNDMLGLPSPDRPGGAAAASPGGAPAGPGAPAGSPQVGGMPPSGGGQTAPGAGVGGVGIGAPGSQFGGLTGTEGAGQQTGGVDPFSWDPQASRELDVDSFLDPSMNFRIQQGTNALESGAAARGGLLSGATLRGVQDYSQNIASQEYGNAVNRAMQDRGFQTGLDQNNRDFQYGVRRDDRDFGESGRRYDQEFDYRSRTGDGDFNYNRDRDDRNFRYGAQRDDRDFGYNRDRENRNFQYGAQTGDREFNYRTLSDLARLGMGGAQGSYGMQQLLAQLLNSNILSSGNVGAAGALGQGNAQNQMIQQLIQMMQQNAWRP
jgi:hypothetical protein